MNAQERLRITLLALLPGDGSLITRKALAEATCLSQEQVATALAGETMAGRVVYDHRIDSYYAVKQGSAL